MNLLQTGVPNSTISMVSAAALWLRMLRKIQNRPEAGQYFHVRPPIGLI